MNLENANMEDLEKELMKLEKFVPLVTLKLKILHIYHEIYFEII